ncbi:SWIM zinc finger family protein [Anoxybacillus sediminis]|nr:SWIM zinc finger family protein [Brevibacillus sp. NL20B1]NNV02477.1 hypothetical protein [Brevibacillus sp. MCWH]REK64691.1 MAG: hypothetical protein DF221_08045 [Brevibacillus sp.]UFJ63100.1 SWIM zinc finger family protein [Anoxybacillus sediminis]
MNAGKQSGINQARCTCGSFSFVRIGSHRRIFCLFSQVIIM